MNRIERYFKKYKDKVNFIKLDKLPNLEFEEDVPVTLVDDYISENIKNGNFLDKITPLAIIDGLIFLIASEDNINLRDKYIKSVKNYNPDIEDYIFFHGINFLNEGSIERSNIYFRAMYIINPQNILATFNYALALERIGEEFLEKDPIIGKEFIDESTLLFEKTLNLDENYSLAYYKLGYHYKFNDQNLKAKLMWEKFLNLDEDQQRLEEIRIQIDEIEDKVNLESALTYMSYNRYDEALDYLNKLLPRHEKWWELYYLMGISYAQLGYNLQAIEYYYKSLELNPDIEDIYNELGIELFKLNEIDEAVKIYSLGIERLDPNYKFHYNRALAYVQLDRALEAYEDAKIAYELRPFEASVQTLYNQLKEELNL